MGHANQMLRNALFNHVLFIFLTNVRMVSVYLIKNIVIYLMVVLMINLSNVKMEVVLLWKIIANKMLSAQITNIYAQMDLVILT